MVYKINGWISKEDGDWLQCPSCLDESFIILSWMRYCPMCRDKLDIEEEE